MPLTFAHPAIVIPLARPLGRFGSLSALICGSMMPDLPYFTMGNLTTGNFGDRGAHSFVGIFNYCLPTGLLCYAIFHLILKRPLLALAPRAVASRLASCLVSPQFRSIRHWWVVALCLVIGATTHIIWDAFTHNGGAGVMFFPGLAQSITTIGRYHIYGYKVLQHGSTLLGLTYLAWRSGYSYRSLTPMPGYCPSPSATSLSATTRSGIICFLLLVTLIMAIGFGCAAAFAGAANALPLQLFVGRAITVGTSVMIGGLLVYSLAWHIWLRRG
jgi:hypothetical protein